MLAGTGMLWLASAPMAANHFVRWVEQPRTPPHGACATVLLQQASDWPVVVLGGAFDAYTDNTDPFEVLSHASLLRVLHAAKFDTGETRFFALGGGQTSRKISTLLSEVLQTRGVDMSRITVETHSDSTLENAVELAKLLPPETAGPIVLVTSALHMNRAEAVFRATGFEVCPARMGTLYSPPAGWVGYMPYIDPLLKSSRAWREVVVSLLYWWRGFSVF